MGLGNWYELRLAGSAGTSTSAGSGMQEGIAIDEHGRLCPLTSGAARRFATPQEAIDFLSMTSVQSFYSFEVVLCGGSGAEPAVPRAA